MHTRLIKSILFAFRAFFLSSLFFLGTRCPCLAQTGKHVLDLCDVLHDFDRYAGKIIEVKGFYKSGREVVGLYGHDCKSPFVLDGVVRPSAVSIDISRSGKVGREAVDSVSIEKLWDTVDQHRPMVSRQGLQVIIRGRLNSMDEVQYYTDKDGNRRPLGCGHLNVFPAQIEVISVQVIDKFDGGKTR